MVGFAIGLVVGVFIAVLMLRLRPTGIIVEVTPVQFIEDEDEEDPGQPVKLTCQGCGRSVLARLADHEKFCSFCLCSEELVVTPFREM